MHIRRQVGGTADTCSAKWSICRFSRFEENRRSEGTYKDGVGFIRKKIADFPFRFGFRLEHLYSQYIVHGIRCD